MREWLEIDFTLGTAEVSDMLVAFLDNMGYDSFHETDSGLKAYILKKDFDKVQLDDLFLLNDPQYSISYAIDEMENKNWNEEWETHYDPIEIDHRLYIRAPFHPQVTGYDLQLIIMPKMSFGTGHHQTTRLMSQLLLDTDLKDKTVLDMGTGTGILAIICEKLGASSVDAIDNFDWAVENSAENLSLNDCTKITPMGGDAAILVGKNYDVVVANINRNVLLEDIKTYVTTLSQGGLLLLSGFYKVDFEIINAEVESHGGALITRKEEDRWLACQYKMS